MDHIVVDAYNEFVRHVVHVETFWTMQEATHWARKYKEMHGLTVSPEYVYETGKGIKEATAYL